MELGTQSQSYTGHHLPHGITQCYLPPDTSNWSKCAPPNLSHAGWYSIYLPRMDGRLSWPSWLDSAPAGSRNSDLSITSPTPNRCTTKTTEILMKLVKYEYEILMLPRKTSVPCERWVLKRDLPKHAATAVSLWQNFHGKSTALLFNGSGPRASELQGAPSY